jgi:hypothetical protein
MKVLSKKIVPSLVLFLVLLTNNVSAQELSPELLLGAVGVVSGNFGVVDGTRSGAVSDFSDTSVLFGARQKLFGSYRGQLIVGFQFPDAESDLGQVFYHHVFVSLANQRNVIQIGRSRLDSNLMEFPTLRDDDALAYTDTQSPFSDGVNSEDTQFGNLIMVGRYLTPRIRFDLHGEYYSETLLEEESFELNTVGFTLGYRVPDSQRWNRHRINELVLGVEAFFLPENKAASFEEETLVNVKFGLGVNLRPDPVHFWRLTHQTIYSKGVGNSDALTSYVELSRAKSVATFTSIEYVKRTNEWPSIHSAVGFGYRIFPDADGTANQFLILANIFKRVGANFDIGIQGVHERSYGDLRSVYPGESFRLNLALVYRVDQVFNRQFDTRESILNLEHGYIY